MSDSDELRRAAERLRNPNVGEAYPWPCDMHEQPAQRSRDAGDLARAYLNTEPLARRLCEELQCPAMEYLPRSVQEAWAALCTALGIAPNPESKE